MDTIWTPTKEDEYGKVDNNKRSKRMVAGKQEYKFIDF